ncbi:MAG: VPLPA-CTERM sorting domain-containing protein [Proteobacteria bacterium]|nr:VPLPA-CTERM sorting domain-containing protein [Pseudomonadota bacterium]
MKSRLILSIVLIFFVVAGFATGAAAYDYTPITFDYNSTSWGRDNSYPTGSPVTLGGVPFDIPAYPNNNTWDSYTWDSNTGYNGTRSITIPVNVANVKEVHTLINTSWGYYPMQYTTVTFNWSGNGVYTKILTDGVDIRDWWNGGYANTISGDTVQVYSGYGTPYPYLPTRVDKQLFTFTDAQYNGRTLESITITDTGAEGTHRAFLYGVTVASSAVPIPGALWLFGPGLVSLAAIRRRFRK